MSKTLDEYITQAMLLGMNYDIRDHTFNKEEYNRATRSLDADTMQPIYGDMNNHDTPDGWMSVYRKRVLDVQEGRLGFPLPRPPAPFTSRGKHEQDS